MTFPTSQGYIHSFQSAQIDVAGRKVVGVKAINWDEACEGEVEYGNGPLPLGVTVGQYMGNCEVEQLLSEYKQLLQRLGGNFRGRGFNLGCQFNEASGLISVEFVDMRIASVSGSFQGKAGATVKYKCQVFKPIRIGGFTMVDRFLSGASFSIGGSVSVSAGGLVSAGAGVSASIF